MWAVYVYIIMQKQHRIVFRSEFINKEYFERRENIPKTLVFVVTPPYLNFSTSLNLYLLVESLFVEC